MKRFEVYLVKFNPTVGHEMQKVRPAVIISPNEMNFNLGMIIVAPLTSTKRTYFMRADCSFRKFKGQIALDQLRSSDKSRCIKKLGKISQSEGEQVLEILQKMFS